MQELNGSSARPSVVPSRSQLSTDKGSICCLEHTEVSSLLESREIESKGTKWTDEKHSLYLNSMEASFVNQLYNSLDMLGWRPSEEGSSEPKVSSHKHNRKGTPTPSGQFKVFRDGSWGRINFARETARVNRMEGDGSVLENPWIRHYKSSCRQGTRISPALQERAALPTDCHLQLDRQDSVGSNTEVTDQNFVDDVSEEEGSSRIRSSKCRKISKAAGSRNDQVVPFEKLSLLGDVGDDDQGSSKE